jgi:phosphatidylinositol alpha-1,6-mannosyltransferase
MSSPDKLKILLITRNFPPLTGGMERLMQNAAQGMAEYAEVTIIGPRGCRQYIAPGVKVYETSPKLGPFLFMSVWHGLLACLRTRFDLILGGSGLTAPTLALLRLIRRSRTGLFIHGLDLVVNNTLYQSVFVPCIRVANFIIANSANTRDIATRKGVAPDRLRVINPGTRLPDLAGIEPRQAFFDRHQIPFEKVIIFVGRMTRRKGLSRFIRNSLPTILRAEPRSGVLVVGDNPNQALTNTGEQDEVKRAVAELGLQDDIRFLGQVGDEDLLACYAHADVQVFPLVEVPDDVEGFGMVAVEAAACGTPTVAFNTGGVADAISELNGHLVEPGRYDLLSEQLVNVLRSGLPANDSCLQHASRYRWEAYHQQLGDLVRGGT